MNITPNQVKKIIDRWRSILKIERQWKISFDIRKSSNEMSDGNQEALACIDVDLCYFLAHIQFNAPEINENELDAVILHELLHIIIEPISCSSGCGLGKKFETINTILCESTIERLMPGYLFLYQKAFPQAIKKPSINNKKSSVRGLRCRHRL